MEKNGAGGEKLPEYHLRAMYRLDWKVRWPPVYRRSPPACPCTVVCTMAIAT
jgi:hypothetical protein